MVAGLDQVFGEMRPLLIRRAVALGAGSDAEDIVQDIWIKLRQADGPFANPQAYLFRMVYTGVQDRRRATFRSAARDASWSAPINAGDQLFELADAERRVIALQTLRAVEGRLAALGDPAASIFRRHRIDGLKQREIAIEFKMGVSTVEKHLRRAYAAILDLSEDRA